jgi:protein involved in polysaccharide export with SLBB domain
VKVAVTAWLAVIVSTHVERPVQSPLQPLKRDLEVGDAVSVTVVPFA